MKKIFETLNRKWTEYLLEIFVIIIGILGAFSLNSWNDSRKENNQEKKLLIELISNLETNIETLNEENIRNTEVLRGSNIILDHFQNSTSNDSLRPLFNRNVFLETLNLSYSTFESLKSKGFDIIKDDQIRLSMIDLFEVSYPHHVRSINQTSSVYLQSFLNWSMQNRDKINQILSSPKYRNGENYTYIRNYIESKIVWKTAIIRGNNKLLEPSIKLKKLIEIYLGQDDN